MIVIVCKIKNNTQITVYNLFYPLIIIQNQNKLTFVLLYPHPSKVHLLLTGELTEIFDRPF